MLCNVISIFGCVSFHFSCSLLSHTHSCCVKNILDSFHHMWDNGGPSSLVAIVTKQFRQTRIVGADNSESTDTPVTSTFYQRSLVMERLNAAALRTVHSDTNHQNIHMLWKTACLTMYKWAFKVNMKPFPCNQCCFCNVMFLSESGYSKRG